MDILKFQSIPAVLRANAARYSDRTAISYKKNGQFRSLAYAEFYERVLMLARGLRRCGMKPGDNIAILSENRLGWAISDFGIQAAGGVVVPIYATNTARQAGYVINHCEARIVFCSTKGQYEKLLSIKNEIPGVELIISYDRFMGERSFPVYTQYQLSEVSTPLSEEDVDLVNGQIDNISPDDLLSIIYTSGTTGPPKGVALSHYNVMINVQYAVSQLGMPLKGLVTLSFLPLSHVFERTGGYYATLLSGNHFAFAENIGAVLENMAEIRPTSMMSVPRLFEKIYSRIQENVCQASPLRRKLFHFAVETGREYVNRKYVRHEPLGLLKMKYHLVDRLIFKKIRARFGGRLSYFVCGGAPLDKTINEFMWVIGMPVFTAYGLTETSPGVTISSVDSIRFGSVGKPLCETELKLAADGELLVRGPQVMKGYFKNDEATAEAMADGWFKTGDIARIDGEGFVYIVDRKKELIVTSGGKNIAPQPIENELRLDKYISQAFIFGDRKPYLVALLTPNIERVINLARKEKIPYIEIADLINHTRIREVFASALARLNQNLSPYQTIKNFALVPREFSVEEGELTPTLKMKRKVIYQKYQTIIEDLYQPKGNAEITRDKPEYGEKNVPN